ncbi:MAG: GNAT family N-acetyltransferase [Faecousia sp.]
MSYRIRRVERGDAFTLATIQTTSWKTAFHGVVPDNDLERLTNIEKATAMYHRLLTEGKGNGYIGEIDGKAHCIAYWDRARDTDMPQYAEIICIHSLPDNWRKGFGGQMMDKVLSDISQAGFEKVMLWVFTENSRARAFYEAKGFHSTDKTKPALGTMEICYERAL